MCFLCETQWPAPERGLVGAALSFWSWITSWWPSTIDGVSGWRPCPHCGAAILKDGGCQMMRCALCHGTFRWGASRNTLDGVIIEHLPPRTRSATPRGAVRR